MALTKVQIRDRVANDLGVLPLNQSLPAQHVTRIEQAYDEVYARLKTRGLATWASTASVPNDLCPYVIALVCDNCLNTYSVSVERWSRIKAIAGVKNGDDAIRAIRELVSPEYVSQENPTDY